VKKKRYIKIAVSILLVLSLMTEPASASAQYWESGFDQFMQAFSPLYGWLTEKYRDTGEKDSAALYQMYADDMQSDLGSTTFNSGGSYRLLLPFVEFKSVINRVGFVTPYGSPQWHMQSHFFEGHVSVGALTASSYYIKKAGWTGEIDAVKARYEMPAPVPGQYKVVGVGAVSGEVKNDKGETAAIKYIWDGGTVNTTNTVVMSAGTEINYAGTMYVHSSHSTSAVLTVPRYIELDVIPFNIATTEQVTSIVNNTNSRIGSVTANYSYADNIYENVKIVNEGSNTVYNPVTNTTTTFNDWTYDYSSRSYVLTTDSGNPTTITYGDEYLTIREGDTVYNISYIIYGNDNGGNNGGENPTPTPTPPGGGNNNNNGNDNDDNGDGFWSKLGQLLGNLGSGLLSLITTALSAILDGLINLVDMVVAKLAAFLAAALNILAAIPAMFTGVSEFFAALFSFLPSEIMIILSFGFLLMVVIGILRMILRR
jgi:hypothetical protein